MNKPKIKVIDSIHAKANKQAREAILPCLQYQQTLWKKGRWKAKKGEVKECHLITGNKNTGGTFLTGLIDRIKSFAKENKVQILFDERNVEKIEAIKSVGKLKNIEFRSDQIRALKAIQRKKRGVIKFPTGSGKTIIALGIFSIYEESPTLFLCHTKDLLYQTEKSLDLLEKKRKIFLIGDGQKASLKKIRKEQNPIVLSTVQSFSKYDPSDWCDFFDITVIDECHRVSSSTSQYGKIMEYNLSPIRIGLSATPPNAGKAQLVCEGFFGPVIAELSMEEGIKKGIIARPSVNLISVPFNQEIASIGRKNYVKTYQLGIVNNEQRNKLIVEEALKSVKKKESVLIVIENTEHGKNLQSIFEKVGFDVPFVWGNSEKEFREKTKRDLSSKRQKVVICSKVWREGINIPSLNHVINAHGMKEEKIIIQAMGRGLRTSKGKTRIKLTDFLDPYEYLAQHCVTRIQIYKEQGWL